MSARRSFETVSDYMAALESVQSKVLKRVLSLVQKSIPDSVAVISYGIPAFKQERVFIYCAAFKRHIGVYPPVHDARLRIALKPYANAKGNLSFSLEEPLPEALIAKVARALARQCAVATATQPKRKRRPKNATPHNKSLERSHDR